MARTIAYLGPAGTYTEEAALRYDAGAVLMPLASIAAVGNAVAVGDSDEGVAPIENSLEGAVNDTLDLLIQESRLRIRRELNLAVEHCLLVAPGTDLDQIGVVISHPQALGQCRDYIKQRFPKADVLPALSTAAAVEYMQEAMAVEHVKGAAWPVPVAAIATRRAAEIYGVVIAEEGIQDRPNNETRFVVLAREDHPPTGRDKTSLCFSFDQDIPGQLYAVLKLFADRNINLAKIESRPTKDGLGRYIFLIDLEGHKLDAGVGEALSALQARVSLCKVFGSYPRFEAS